jgi:hypothetical protein
MISTIMHPHFGSMLRVFKNPIWLPLSFKLMECANRLLGLLGKAGWPP